MSAASHPLRARRGLLHSSADVLRRDGWRAHDRRVRQLAGLTKLLLAIRAPGLEEPTDAMLNALDAEPEQVVDRDRASAWLRARRHRLMCDAVRDAETKETWAERQKASNEAGREGPLHQVAEAILLGLLDLDRDRPADFEVLAEHAEIPEIAEVLLRSALLSAYGTGDISSLLVDRFCQIYDIELDPSR